MPLGITTASVPYKFLSVSCAISLTAIRALSFSIMGSMSGPTAATARKRDVDAWNVPTSGPSAAKHARSDTEGMPGSCICNTSKSPLVIQLRTRADAIGPNRTRATEPLKGIGIGRPALTNQGSLTESSSLTGAITET